MSDNVGYYRTLAIFALLTVLVVSNSWAMPTEEQIVKAVLGEARGSSQVEMQAIASAIINRGHLRGVYGYGVDIDKSDAKTRLRASNAVLGAYGHDVTNGATHWLSEWDLKHCRPSLIAWKDKMRITHRTKNFTFYREV